jgi:PAS domain S-box-containing protein
MNIYVVIAILSVWLLINIITKIVKKKKADYSFIVTFAFILGFSYFYFYEDIESTNFEYYSYILLSVFTIYLIVKGFKGSFRKDISEFDYYEIEEEMEALSNATELLRKRFISTIELLNDGISFSDEGEKSFGTDRYISILGLKNNEFNKETQENLIYKDDLVQYKSVIEKLSKKNPIYSTTYRVEKDGTSLWIKEVGKKIYLNKKTSIISIIKPMDIRQFPVTEIEVLNNLPGDKKMYNEMQRLSKNKQPFNLVLMQLSNIPKINEKYGRDVGDLMMGEYLKKTRFNFIKDDISLYRMGGIKYGLIIKDEKKYEILERALIGGGDLLNMKMIFGGITQTIYPNFGISESPYMGKNTDKVIEEAQEALKITLKDNSSINYCFYDKL